MRIKAVACVESAITQVAHVGVDAVVGFNVPPQGVHARIGAGTVRTVVGAIRCHGRLHHGGVRCVGAGSIGCWQISGRRHRQLQRDGVHRVSEGNLFHVFSKHVADM